MTLKRATKLHVTILESRFLIRTNVTSDVILTISSLQGKDLKRISHEIREMAKKQLPEVKSAYTKNSSHTFVYIVIDFQ